MKHIFMDKEAVIPQASFVAPNAMVLGDVTLSDGASIWFGSVLRGDINQIKIGKCTNIQDLSVLHVDLDKPCIVGDYVTVGHNANLHGCIVGDNVLIGIGAIVLSGADIGPNSIIGAGSVVPEGASLPGGHLYLGIPAKPKRELTPQEIAGLKAHAENYWDMAKRWKEKIESVELG
ncbi:MAG: gamma carbonic anhydrase family protein [Armatimonadota bacterium]